MERQVGRFKVGKGAEEYRDNPEGRVRALSRLRVSLAKLLGQKPTPIDRINAHYAKYDELLAKNEAMLKMMGGSGWQDVTQDMRETLARDTRELPDQVLTMARNGDMQALVTALRILQHRKFLELGKDVEREQGHNVAASQKQFRAALKEQGD